MLGHATSKIEFLKTEIIRQEHAAAATVGEGQVNGALALRFTLENRLIEVDHRIEVEKRVHEAAKKMIAAGLCRGKVALTEARQSADESDSKLELLVRAQKILSGAVPSCTVPGSSAAAAASRSTGKLVSGCLTMHVVQAEGLLTDTLPSGRRIKFRPYVVAAVGNAVTAQTSACRKPGTTPKWSETLTLRFTRERECELKCFSGKSAMCGVQYLQLEDLLDGATHKVRVPLEPQGALWLEITFANVLVINTRTHPTLNRARALRVKRQHGRSLVRAAERGVDVTPWVRHSHNDDDSAPAWTPKGTPTSTRLAVAGGSSSRLPRRSPAGARADDLPPFDLDASSPARRSYMMLSPVPAHSPIAHRGSGGHTLHMADFHVLRLLGQGHFGKVLLAQRKGTPQLAAIKCIKKSDIILREEEDSMWTEANVFRAINKGRSNFVLRLYGAFQTASHVCFAMEYCAGGDLLAHIQRSGPFDGGRARFYTSCVVLALRFLHQRSIIYRDLKLDNILIDGRGYARLADYGLCKENVGSVDFEPCITTNSSCR